MMSCKWSFAFYKEFPNFSSFFRDNGARECDDYEFGKFNLISIASLFKKYHTSPR